MRWSLEIEVASHANRMCGINSKGTLSFVKVMKLARAEIVNVHEMLKITPFISEK